jgi:signal transduction histidine kinase
VLYLAEKVAFLAVLAIAWHTSHGIWRSIYVHLFGASLFYALSSYVANWAIQRGVYSSGSFYDLPLVASLAWMTYVGLVAFNREAETSPDARSEGTGVWIARLGMIAVFSLPLFAVSTVFDTKAPQSVRTFRLVVTLGCMLGMGVLVFLKQHLLDRELLHLLRTSQESFENLQRLQTQLVQSEKLASLGQLVGGAAHELNNPLTAMIGYSDLLSTTPLNHEQQALAEKIGTQVRRTKTLIANLLSFARQTPGEKSHVDLNTLVQTAIKLSQPQLQAANVQVESIFSPGLPRVFGDSNQLLQVCLQIINNAVFAMEGGGVLAISTQLQGSSVQAVFRDHGPGIQDPERVFDPFYTTRPVGLGSGLGLSACYGIIQEHNGQITCENAVQGGAIFSILLPASLPNGNGKMVAARTGVSGSPR